MIGWVLLVAAVLTEVSATVGLRVASAGRPRWYLLVVVGYLLAFTALSGALAHGVPLGVAYGIWTALGVALTAIASRMLFGEPLTRPMIVGLVLIMVGVLLVEIGH